MASNSKEEDFFNCPICFERFVKPKYLPCLHSFCLACLNTYILSQQSQQQTFHSFPCPVCRQTVQVPDQNIPIEKTADLMPNNHLIVSLMERSSLVNTSQSEKTCEPCAIDNQTLATSWCTNCQEALCLACSRVHTRQKVSKHHVLVPIADFSKHENKKFDDIDEPCMEHSGKVLEVYCVDHKQMCCVICLATRHRKCENISTFEEMLKGAKDEVSIEDFFRQLEIINKKTEILCNITEDNVKELDISRTDFVEKTTSTIEEAKEKLEKLKDDVLKQINQVHKEQNRNLVDRKDRMEIFQTEVKKSLNMLKTVYKHCSAKQVFITKEKLKLQLTNHLEILEGFLKNNNRNVGIVLHLDNTLSAVANHMTSVAEVKVITTSDITGYVDEVISAVNSICSLADVNKVNTDIPVDFKSLVAIKVHNIGRTNSSFVPGGTFLSDGSLVLCDCSHGRLKVFGTSGSLLFEVQMNSKPWDVACYSSDKLVVSFYVPHIKLFTVQSDSFMETVTIPLKCPSQGVAVANDKIIVAFPRSIDIITVEGKCMHSIQRSCGYPRYVAASPAGNIYYSERYNTVVCRSLDNKEEVFQYTDQSLKKTAGITLDNHGNVYVCGNDSGTVHLITSDGEAGIVLIENLGAPYAIGFDKDGKRFFVSKYDSGHNYVDVYELSVKKTNTN